MSMQEVTKRSLGELEARVQPVGMTGGNNLKYLINLASTKLPSAVYNLAYWWVENRGYAPNEADEIAKATRWLAVIRRDFGEQAFKEITEKMLS